MSPDQPFAEPPDDDTMPRFAGIPTFMRLPHVPGAQGLDIALAGVPWDGGTTNRPGARHGPRGIRDASSLIRRIHHASGVAPFELCRVGDASDASVNPIDLGDTMARVEAFFSTIVGNGAAPLSGGGDHLITLPILRVLAADGAVGLVHFDAHSDTADTYFGGERYTHGTPFRRAVEEGLIDPARTIQIGIRGALFDRDDWAFAHDSGMRVVPIEELYELGLDAVMEEARRIAGDGPVYVSFDVDGLDPVYAPGTGTPEVGGFTAHEAQRMIRTLAGLDIVGGDVVEVAPPFDPSGNTALVGATMMFEILCILAPAVRHRRD